MNMSRRMNIDPLMILQNLQVIHGRPGFSSAFLIALVNRSGILEGRLKFMYDGEGDSRSCFALGVESGTQEVLEGTPVSIQMAKDQGWYDRRDRNGKVASKWPSMPDQMLMYRAAAFWVRMYAADLVLGFHSQEELHDFDLSSDNDIIPETPQSINATDIIETLTATGTDETPENETEAQPENEAATQLDLNQEKENLDIHESPFYRGGDWFDSENVKYDPDLHAWSKENKKPSVKKDGTFRARVNRAEDNEQEPQNTQETQETQENEAPEQEKNDDTSALFKSYRHSIQTTKDQKTLDRLRPENYDDFGFLSPGEQRAIINLIEMQERVIINS